MGTRNVVKQGIYRREGAMDLVYTDEREIPKGFFEMSKIVDSPEMLEGWVEWFSELDIPCAIVRGPEGFTLWRKGKEVGVKTSAASSAIKRRSIVRSSTL